MSRYAERAAQGGQQAATECAHSPRKDYANLLAMVKTIKSLPPRRRLALCVDFTERVIRVYDNYARADTPDPETYFADMRDLLLELRREV